MKAIRLFPWLAAGLFAAVVAHAAEDAGHGKDYRTFHASGEIEYGQIGDSYVVYFRRIGPKVLMMQRNYGHRAESDDAFERRAVEERRRAARVRGRDALQRHRGTHCCGRTAREDGSYSGGDSQLHAFHFDS